MMIRILGILTVAMLSMLLFAVSCGEDASVTESLRRAEMVMDEHPDSALAILGAIPEDHIENKGDMARYALLVSQGRHKANVYETSDSLIDRAVDYYDRREDDDNLMKSLFYKGNILINRGELSEALDINLRATALAMNIGDYYWIAKVLEQTADIYSLGYYESESLELTRRASEYYRVSGHYLNFLYSKRGEASSLVNTGRVEAGLALLDSILTVARDEIRDTILANILREDKVTAYVMSDQYDKIGAPLDSLKANGGLDPENNLHLLYIAANELYHQNYPATERYLSMAGGRDLRESERSLMYLLYAEMYKGRGDFKREALYGDSIIRLQGDVLASDIRHALPLTHRDYYLGELNLERKYSGLLKRTAITVIILLILVIATGVVAYRMRLRVKDLEIEEKISNIQSLADEIAMFRSRNIALEVQLKSGRSEIESLSRDLERMKRDLSALDLTERRILSQNEIAGYLVDSWGILESLCGDFDDEDEEKKAQLYDRLQTEISKLKEAGYLSRIVSSVNRYMGGVVDKLRNSGLRFKEDDFVFISMLIAGMSPRMVSMLLDMKVKNYYNRRSRFIRKISESSFPDREFVLSCIPDIKNKKS